MASKPTHLRIFVASPGELRDERMALGDVVVELNKGVAKQYNLHLELWRWEHDAVPGTGTDTQAVINEQIGDEYDIFIGMMGTQFGTSTPRAGSGTAEEFARAIDRFEKDPRSLRIMVYFKDALVRQSQLDPEQLKKVNAFKARVSGMGNLYFEFSDTESFQPLLRIHLTKILADWGKTWGEPMSRREQCTSCENSDPPSDGDASTAFANTEDEPGLLDLVIDGIGAFEEYTESTSRIIAAMSELSTAMKKHTQKFTALAKQGSQDPREIRRAVNRASEPIESFVRTLETEAPVLKDKADLGFRTLSQTALVLGDFGEAGHSELRKALAELDEMLRVLPETGVSAMAARSGISSLPRITTRINRARRGAVAAIDSYVSHISSVETIAKQTADVIRDVLDTPGGAEPE